MQKWEIKVLELTDECINFLKINNSKFKHSNKDSMKNKAIATA